MLVVPKKKVVLLNLNNPARVLQVIPTAKTLEYKGRTLVAVPHRIDETKVLRNIGFDVPSPIRFNYKWSGQYTPLQHQLATAEFLTLHNRAFVLNDIGCVDSTTEYLSPTGWVPISEYTSGAVAQYHPETGAIEFVEPIEYVKKPCDTMYRIKTTYGLDQLLSPEHRVLLRARSNHSKMEVVPAEVLFGRQEVWRSGARARKSADRVGWTQAAIPTTFVAPGGSGVPLSEAEMRLQIAVIADGHFPNKSNTCVVRIKKPRKIQRLAALLRAADVPYKERVITESSERSDVGFHIFSFTAPTRDKEFRGVWWEATRPQLEVIADEVLYWDSCVTRGARFSSASKASADFVQYVFAGTGRTARLLVDPRGCYTVQIRTDGKPLQLTSNGAGGKRNAVMAKEPSTDGYKYCFVVPSSFLLFRRNGCVFASGNTGKTLAALWAYDFMRARGYIHKLLISSPLSTLERVWGDTLFMHFPHLTYSVLHNPSRERRVKLLEQDVDVYIVNHDGLKLLEEPLAARTDIDAFLIDEIATFRNAGTALFKALQRLVPGRKVVWGMTGAPTPKAPTDAWAQCRLIAPDGVPRYFGKFRDLTMRQVSQFKWVPRPEALPIVKNAMQPAIRFKREECIDLPPTTVTTRHVPLSAEQSRMYLDMVQKLRAEYAGGQVLASNEAVKAGKLLQICCGAVYGNNGETILVPSKQRIEVVREVIDEAEGKVIVFVPLIGGLQHVADKLAEDYTVEVVQGATKPKDRDRIFLDFQQATNPRVLVAHPECMAHGLTLTAATVIVWFIPIFDFEIYEQACGRITRQGQTRNTLIVHIEGTPIERAVYERLAQKQAVQGSLLQLIKDGD